jgi:hypothetical protein
LADNSADHRLSGMSGGRCLRAYSMMIERDTLSIVEGILSPHTAPAAAHRLKSQAIFAVPAFN